MINFQKTGDKNIKKIVQKHCDYANKSSKNWYKFGPAASMVFILAPVLPFNRKYLNPNSNFPLPVYIPGVDVSKSPIYEIIYIYVTLIVVVGVLVFVSHSNMLSSISVFCLAQIEVLEYKLNHLDVDFDKENNSNGKLTPKSEIIKRNFISCVDMHSHIFR